ncbi:MAG: type I restriction endonuclease subunit R [Mesorhizobium sp.]|uniref:type I restriction endonuclease subunit R n=1 Tax=Mesorhizobium sp. TaxID=1871066 RepID=UPI000FE665EB|nr:type I restriction endonuclease [Mesorhizobium sp.]RWH84360.1 MAG: type I restriction endonuclease subunit R [Mesorhizobium sp.]RWH86746.1 MAG: type I restriction endonuclease subunit R [Mesorhizobium sp.]RWH93716.1 MAG: type I restriction endonuclease subunit R [Mesorhizobium sp.]RWI02827.1 MAG: type I restriction endonuclease subunit R [Mesorhizobium sp.]RWI05337.1 MAG: type I restriction endonuclease subunit R [Mesorhizobium sp.]
MSLHKEISFEAEICDHLAATGWLYAETDAAAYDRTRSLFPADVVTWVRASQPNAWDTLTKSHGAGAGPLLLDRIRKQLDERGALDVIRHGVEMIGLRAPLALAQFKPALAMNADILARYQANRLRVVRQVHYSLANENAIDLVLFLNGLPVATVELKTDFTQSVTDAVDQYRFDRQPSPKGQTPEPLLSFPSGALVHFAVSNAEVMMTTRLEGPHTRFLPFNKGNGGGKGNPPNAEGHPTAYLWEDIWQRDSWLEILGRYVVAERDTKKKIKGVIFPRFHQLDATRKLRASVLAEGAGGKYLIQHSAGSGKTNSIAWTAHFLADLHDEKHQKVFDTVLVVSDRNVIDTQLQEAIFNFERTTGVVATINSDSGAKSGQLAQALAGGKKIVVCTIQTFPFALKAVQDLAASQGKRFAVIADEAHSSQTGAAAAQLKAVLSPEELADLGDGGEISSEDILAAQMAARASAKGITYVAFTATPKAKTLELFGRRPFPDQAASEANLPAAFHVYSMRQAIEEGFILDVLHNYTPYSLAFKLAHEGKEMDDAEVERSAAVRSLMRWVRLHDYNISQKVEVVVEHYRSLVQPLLDGKAKAMVVVGSRVEAVRWQLAINKYIKEKGYKLGTLVAFSGEVNDQKSGPDPFSETSKELNAGLNGRDIREAFKLPEYHILLVANKFQTGFDQPLLCGMYVDRRLAGIQAVQTLSRLNRAHPGKDTTYVLDFVNSSDDILKAFQTYYETASLENVTDPNLVFDLRAKLDALGYYDDFEVDRVVKVELDPASKQGDLVASLTPVVDRLLRTYRDAHERLRIATSKDDAKAAQDAQDTMDALVLFRADMGAFVRLYAFMSQIFDYGNTAIESRHIFYRRLIPLLEFGRERQEIDVSGLVLTHHKLADKGKRTLALGGFGEPLQPIYDAGSGSVHEKQKALLAEIVAKLNDLFQGDVTDDDQLIYVNNVIKGKLMESETLAQQAANNTKEQFANSPHLSKSILDAIIDAFEAHTTMSKQALDSAKIREGLKDVLLGPGQLWEELRQRRDEANISP